MTTTIISAYFGALVLAIFSFIWKKFRIVEPRTLMVVIIVLAILTITGYTHVGAPA